MAKKLLMTASTFSHIRNFHLPYLAEFKRLGWEVHVACGGGETAIPCCDRSISLPMEKSFTSPSNFRACAKLRKLIKKERYDLVITHTSLAAFFTRLAEKGLRRRPRTVNVVHGYLFDDRSSRLRAAVLKAAEYLTAPQTDLVLTMNGYDTLWAGTHPVAKEVRSVPGMGIDREKLAVSGGTRDCGAHDSDFVLIYPAEFSERKNQAMLIRALPRLPGEVKLLLPGDGALLDDCKALAEKLGVAERVVFPGYIRNVGAAFAAADAAVSSSRSEGLPFNVVEAMLCSLPVIASRVKGHTDLVEDGVTGYLYDYNDEAAFAEAVKRLYNDREAAQTMGAAGKEKADRYALENAFQAVMDAYLG